MGKLSNLLKSNIDQRKSRRLLFLAQIWKSVVIWEMKTEMWWDVFVFSGATLYIAINQRWNIWILVKGSIVAIDDLVEAA